MRIRSAAFFALSLYLPFSPAIPAQNPPLHLIVSNGVKTVIEELQPQCERTMGRPLAIEYGTTSGLKQKIEGGESFDLAILTSDAIDALVKSGKARGPVPIARCGIGVGVRSGASKPNLATPDAVKRMLLDAKSVAYAGNGASRVYIDQMIDHMGIAGQVKPKTILTEGSVAAGEKVAAGQAGLLMTLVSEILPMKGVTLAGPLPPELQNYVNFSVAAGSQAPSTASQKLIRFLSSSMAAATYKAKGLEPAR
jgi:molybdate transport system substrate-binding protein